MSKEKKVALGFLALLIMLFSSVTIGHRYFIGDGIHAEEIELGSMGSAEDETKEEPINPAGVEKMNLMGDELTLEGSVPLTVELDSSTEIDATPVIQKVKVDDPISNTLTELATTIKGNNVKLKNPLSIDSSKIGFQWVSATLIDNYQKEKVIEIPVNVYNPTTTIFDDKLKMALDVKNNTEMTLDAQTASNNEKLDQLLLNNAQATAWNTENGTKNSVGVKKSIMKHDYGSYLVTFHSHDFTKPKNEITKDIKVMITDSSELGWELSDNKSFFENKGYKIQWYQNTGKWWYTYNGDRWMNESSIEANLIIDGSFPTGSDWIGEGFFSLDSSSSAYYVNSSKKALKRTFIYLNMYKIDIIQDLLDNNAVEVTYRVTNLSDKTKKIGVSQFVDTFVGSDAVPITPVNNFKGVNLSHFGKSLVVLPDPKTMPNWAGGSFRNAANFRQYSVQNASGIGWETGKRYRESDYLITPPEILKENISVDLGDSAIVMKNPGIDVLPNQITSFKQIIKYGVLAPPELTVNQTKGSIYKDESFDITGTILDSDNHNYNIYIELDDTDKTLVGLKEYHDIPYGDKQSYVGEIKGTNFNVGTHNLKVVAIDEYGTRSKEYPLVLTIAELSATPIIQKVKVGGSLSNTLSVLFKDVKGVNVKLKNPVSLDTSKVGFKWVDAILVSGTKEIAYKIPVNIYDPISTVIDDTNQLMLDAKNVSFNLPEVQSATDLNDLVSKKVAANSWNMTDGTVNAVTLTDNGIKPNFGTYTGEFTGVNSITGKKIQRTVNLDVGGELKFKSVPSILVFEKSKINSKEMYVDRTVTDWEIGIENTIGSTWSLHVKGQPLKTSSGDSIKEALILKKIGQKDLIITSSNQKVGMGNKNEANPTIKWSKTEGLLLKINPGEKAGNYSGQLDWTLTDAP